MKILKHLPIFISAKTVIKSCRKLLIIHIKLPYIHIKLPNIFSFYLLGSKSENNITKFIPFIKFEKRSYFSCNQGNILYIIVAKTIL